MTQEAGLEATSRSKFPKQAILQATRKTGTRRPTQEPSGFASKGSGRV